MGDNHCFPWGQKNYSRNNNNNNNSKDQLHPYTDLDDIVTMQSHENQQQNQNQTQQQYQQQQQQQSNRKRIRNQFLKRKPVFLLIRIILLCIPFPACIVWYITDGHWILAFCSAFIIPMLVIIQGSLGILVFRFYFCNSPKPISPSHGVVKVITNNSSNSSSSNNTKRLTIRKDTNTTTTTKIGNTTTTTNNNNNSTNCVSPKKNSPTSSPTFVAGTTRIRKKIDEHHYSTNDTNNDPIKNIPSYQNGTSSSSSPTNYYNNNNRYEIYYNDDRRGTEHNNSSSSNSELNPHNNDNHNTNNNHSNDDNNDDEPLRILVIGDSLAIGVGQSTSCTPILPEVVAKTLSQRFHGRTVYWTCHGASGASTGWVVRELERAGLHHHHSSSNNSNNPLRTRVDSEMGNIHHNSSSYCTNANTTNNNASYDNCHDESDKRISSTMKNSPISVQATTTTTTTRMGSGRRNNKSKLNHEGENEESTTIEEVLSSSSSSSSFSSLEKKERKDTIIDEKKITSTATTRQKSNSSNSSNSNKVHRMWRERLAQHRQRFEQSEILGPYDVVIAITGSNDLKSAFFPFLLTGEDAEFRKQAMERGGNYSMELRRLLDTLYCRMRNKLHVHTSSVRDLIIQTAPSLSDSQVFNSLFKHQQQQQPVQSTTTTSAINQTSSNVNVTNQGTFTRINKRELYMEHDRECEYIPPYSSMPSFYIPNSDPNHHQQQQQQQQYNSNRLPLVVLPGLQARALPIFKNPPLRWFAVPIVDILDLNKSKLASVTDDDIVGGDHENDGENENNRGGRRHHLNDDEEEHNVLFVPPASVSEMQLYNDKMGMYYQQRVEEHVLLCLRDIRRKDALVLEQEIQNYYMKQKEELRTKKSMNVTRRIVIFLHSILSPSWTLSQCFSVRHGSKTSSSPSNGGGGPPCHNLFSVDSIHPNENGYDFWGRYIANDIADKLLVQQRQGSLIVSP